MALSPSHHPSYAAECGDPSRTKKLGFGAHPALLLLDICDAYFSPSSPLCLPSSTLTTITSTLTSLLTAARKENTPIIYATTTYTRPSLADAGLPALKTSPAITQLFSSESHHSHPPSAAEYTPLLPQKEDIIIKKKYPSPFFGTNLATQLAALGVDTLVIGGFLTSGSVRAAALDAMQAGFRAMVVGGGCGDLGGESENHWANLMDVAAKYGDVVEVGEGVGCLGVGVKSDGVAGKGGVGEGGV
ncbi:Isochorismatase hydrolase [Podospora aff. communis PSN243]|uniref:Isochorismatase hydrolase n=1 Tax=Podospora aff. communis PSN243 TaxID=3040156 RepID=A0AAV9GE05_9PEZI|nr:Isochorismatase hydrolase [Podospora aff. communis PSN243]